MKFKPKRQDIYFQTKQYIAGSKGQQGLHRKMYDQLEMSEEFERLTGLMTHAKFAKHGIHPAAYDPKKPAFVITNLREINRVGPTGKKVNQIIFSLVQTARLVPMENGKFRAVEVAEKNKTEYLKFRGGTSFIFDLDEDTLKYSISKPIFATEDPSQLDQSRLDQQYRYQYDEEMNGMSDLEKYFDLNRHTSLQEPFALLHNH
jgi:hypothetical protein